MRKILKEPLLHFLLIGAALFLVFDLVDAHPTVAVMVVPNLIAWECWELTRAFAGIMKRREAPDFRSAAQIRRYILSAPVARQSVTPWRIWAMPSSSCPCSTSAQPRSIVANAK